MTSRLAYILLAIFLGGLRIHNNYAGYTKKAIIQLVLGLLSTVTLGVTGLVAYIWAIVDAITVKSDANGRAMR